MNPQPPAFGPGSISPTPPLAHKPEGVFRRRLSRVFVTRKRGAARRVQRTPAKFGGPIALLGRRPTLSHSPSAADSTPRATGPATPALTAPQRQQQAADPATTAAVLADGNLHVRRAATANPHAPAHTLDLLRRAGATDDGTGLGPARGPLNPDAFAQLVALGEWARRLAARHSGTGASIPTPLPFPGIPSPQQGTYLCFVPCLLLLPLPCSPASPTSAPASKTSKPARS